MAKISKLLALQKSSLKIGELETILSSSLNRKKKIDMRKINKPL